MSRAAKWMFCGKYACYRPRAFAMFRSLQESQHWSIERHLEQKAARQRNIVSVAFRCVPFYQRFYSAVGFDAGDVGQEGFFERLPILQKEHLRECFGELAHPELRRHMAISSTGGSTGVPVSIGYDRRLPVEAFGWRMLHWWGIHPWSDGAYIWRNPRRGRWAEVSNSLAWWPTRRIRMDASSITEESVDTFLLEFNAIKPLLLQGYVGAIDEVARSIERRRLLVHSPKAVWLTSAPILSTQRLRIERVFHAPVFDQYGSCEVAHMAAQCERRSGLHVNVERVHLEFVDDADRQVPCGEWGRALVTRLDDFCFPLIRYEIGDRGRLLKNMCSCGRNLPLIDSVKGRTTDIVRLPSGRVLSGEYLTTIFDGHPEAVAGFRVTQKRDASLLVEFIPVDYARNKLDIDAVEHSLRRKVADEVPVRFVSVDRIPHDRGKLRFVVRESAQPERHAGI